MELAGAVAVERPAAGRAAAAAPAERAEAEPPAAPEPSDVLLGAVAAAMALVKAHRMHGHLAAHLDPLGSEPPGDPALDPENLIPRLTPELQSQVPARVLRVAVPGATLADVLPRLRETYCGTIAYEIEHISSHERRVWLRQVIESGAYRRPLPAEEKRHLLERLCEVEGFERYLHRAFIGQKQFSIEGLDVLVPMLDETLELAAASGARRVVLGMAHRGRLNVLAHVLGRPDEQLLREFEGEREIGAVTHKPEESTGDVKYHLGASADRQTSSGEVHVVLASNPSHLEAVDPVVEGLTRADQTDHTGPAGAHDPTRAARGADPRRCGLPGAGRRRGDAEPAGRRRLRDGRHAPRDRQQPGRLHDRPRGGSLDPLLERSGEGLRLADHPRQRRRPRGRRSRRSGWRSPTASASATTWSSI